jgi:hypothetical protein
MLLPESDKETEMRGNMESDLEEHCKGKKL